MFIFDQWQTLQFSFNAQTKTQILNVIKASTVEDGQKITKKIWVNTK